MKQQTTFIFESIEPKRLDKALVERFSSHSRTYFHHLIDNQLITVNGISAKKRTLLKKGDAIALSFLTKPPIDVTPEKIPLDVIFEDDHLLCINKPQGMVVHPAPGHEHHTLVHALLHHVGGALPNMQDDPLRPGIVHRLDKDTSGVLIAVKTAAAYQHLIKLFSNRKVSKYYLAICIGNPGTKRINAPIGRDPRNRQKMTTLPENGKEAITEITTLFTHQTLSLVCIRPITGRTHQIRVHLKALRCPILGDNIYGCTKINQKWGITRQLLHAYQIEFSHPLSDKALLLRAPLPHNFDRYLDQVGISSDHKTALKNGEDLPEGLSKSLF